MNEAAPAVPQVVILEDFDHDLSLPTDDIPLLTVLLPLSLVLVVFLAVMITSVAGESRLLLRDGLGLRRGEQDVERLAKADGQANERHQRHVQRASLDLLKVLPVHIAPLGGFFQGPLGGMTKRPNASPESPLLLLEASGGSVGLGWSLRLGGGHAARPSGFRLALNTSHVTRNDLTSLVPSQKIGRWAKAVHASIERSSAPMDGGAS